VPPVEAPVKGAERIQLQGPVDLHLPLRGAPHRHQVIRVHHMGLGGIRIELDGAPEFLVGGGPVPLGDVRIGETDVHLGARGVQGQRPLRQRLDVGQGLGRRHEAGIGAAGPDIRHPHEGGGVIRILFEREAVVFLCGFQPLAGQFGKMKTTFQACLVRFRIHRPRRGQPLGFFRRELQADFTGDRRDDVVLEGEHVAHIPFVAFGPDLLLGVSVHELGVNPHPVAEALHRTGDQGIHTQFLGDLVRGLVGFAEAHHRSPGDDALQAAETAEIRDQSLVQAGRQIILLGVTGKVRQRQHRQPHQLSRHLEGEPAVPPCRHSRHRHRRRQRRRGSRPPPPPWP